MYGTISGVDASFWNSLALFATVFAGVAAAVPFAAALRSWFRRTWGSRWELKHRLAKMVVGVTNDHVRSLFGVPIMQHESPGLEDSIDYVFRTDHAWIVARIRHGAVTAWSITVTDRKFKIDLQDLTFGLVHGKLGHSTFAEVVERPTGKYEERGAATYAYAESTYFGRPSQYQTFVSMHNLEGVGVFKHSGQDVVASGAFAIAGRAVGDPELLEETREATTVNTFYSCGLSAESLGEGAATWPVVHRDRVSPLRGATKERKKWLKQRTKSSEKTRKQSASAESISNESKS